MSSWYPNPLQQGQGTGMNYQQFGFVPQQQQQQFTQQQQFAQQQQMPQQFMNQQGQGFQGYGMPQQMTQQQMYQQQMYQQQVMQQSQHPMQQPQHMQPGQLGFQQRKVTAEQQKQHDALNKRRQFEQQQRKLQAFGQSHGSTRSNPLDNLLGKKEGNVASSLLGSLGQIENKKNKRTLSQKSATKPELKSPAVDEFGDFKQGPMYSALEETTSSSTDTEFADFQSVSSSFQNQSSASSTPNTAISNTAQFSTVPPVNTQHSSIGQLQHMQPSLGTGYMSGQIPGSSVSFSAVSPTSQFQPMQSGPAHMSGQVSDINTPFSANQGSQVQPSFPVGSMSGHVPNANVPFSAIPPTSQGDFTMASSPVGLNPLQMQTSNITPQFNTFPNQNNKSLAGVSSTSAVPLDAFGSFKSVVSDMPSSSCSIANMPPQNPGTNEFGSFQSVPSSFGNSNISSEEFGSFHSVTSANIPSGPITSQRSSSFNNSSTASQEFGSFGSVTSVNIPSGPITSQRSSSFNNSSTASQEFGSFGSVTSINIPSGPITSQRSSSFNNSSNTPKEFSTFHSVTPNQSSSVLKPDEFGTFQSLPATTGVLPPPGIAQNIPGQIPSYQNVQSAGNTTPQANSGGFFQSMSTIKQTQLSQSVVGAAVSPEFGSFQSIPADQGSTVTSLSQGLNQGVTASVDEGFGEFHSQKASQVFPVSSGWASNWTSGSSENTAIKRATSTSLSISGISPSVEQSLEFMVSQNLSVKSPNTLQSGVNFPSLSSNRTENWSVHQSKSLDSPVSGFGTTPVDSSLNNYSVHNSVSNSHTSSNATFNTIPLSSLGIPHSNMGQVHPSLSMTAGINNSSAQTGSPDWSDWRGPTSTGSSGMIASTPDVYQKTENTPSNWGNTSVHGTATTSENWAGWNNGHQNTGLAEWGGSTGEVPLQSEGICIPPQTWGAQAADITSMTSSGLSTMTSPHVNPSLATPPLSNIQTDESEINQEQYTADLEEHIYGVTLPDWCKDFTLLPSVYRQVSERCLSGSVMDTSLLYPILMSSNVSQEQLAHIWSVSNKHTPGQLNNTEANIVLALVALAQAGMQLNKLTIEKLKSCKTAPIPSFPAHVFEFPTENDPEDSTATEEIDPNDKYSVFRMLEPHQRTTHQDNVNKNIEDNSKKDDAFGDFQSTAPPSTDFNAFHQNDTPSSEGAQGTLSLTDNIKDMSLNEQGSVWKDKEGKTRTGSFNENFNLKMKGSGKAHDLKSNIEGQFNSFQSFIAASVLKSHNETPASGTAVSCVEDSNAGMWSLQQNRTDPGFADFQSAFTETSDAFADFQAFSSDATELATNLDNEIKNTSELFSKAQTGSAQASEAIDKYSAFRATFGTTVAESAQVPIEEPSSQNDAFGQVQSDQTQSSDEFTNFSSAFDLEATTVISDQGFGSFDAFGSSTGNSHAPVNSFASFEAFSSGTVKMDKLNQEDDFGSFKSSSGHQGNSSLGANKQIQGTFESHPRTSSVNNSAQIPLELTERYKAFTNEKEDMDKHSKVWFQCLSSCQAVIKEAESVMKELSSDVSKEVISSNKGHSYLQAVVEVYRVVCRVKASIKKTASEKPKLPELLQSIEASWSNLKNLLSGSDLLPDPSMLDFNSHHVNSDNEDSSLACGLCLLNINKSSSAAGKHANGHVSYGGRSYHTTCANLWCNKVDSVLPALLPVKNSLL